MKEYLGDGVYAEVENGMVKLTTESDEGATNTIFLEPAVLYALRRYCERVRRHGPPATSINED